MTFHCLNSIEIDRAAADDVGQHLTDLACDIVMAFVHSVFYSVLRCLNDRCSENFSN